jgi:DNA-binding MarR family transcriptional regulator
MDAAEALERLSNEVAAAVARAGLAGLAPEEIVDELRRFLELLEDEGS